MGVLCSTVDKEGDDPPESKAQVELQPAVPRKLHKMPQVGRPGTRSQSWRVAVSGKDFETQAAYDKARESLQAAERAVAFDAEVNATASSIEQQAVEIVQKIRLHDWDNIYGRPFDANGTSTGMKAPGQHFLGNVDFINKTLLLDVAKRMPKGAHLHIHFNSCLPANFLIRQARDIDAMYIRSTVPLTARENWTAARISFMVMTPHEATHVKDADGTEKNVPLGNVWSSDYVSNTWMSYKEFQNTFVFIASDGTRLRGTEGAEIWLEQKMQISEEEAHATHQTGRG
jgi:adenosine deaminase CECR1